MQKYFTSTRVIYEGNEPYFYLIFLQHLRI